MKDSTNPSIRGADESEERDLAIVERQSRRNLRDADRPSVTSTVLPIATCDREGRPRKQADILTDVGKQHLLFRDRNGTSYARVNIKNHAEVHIIDSRAYREILAESYLRLVGKGCNRNAMGDALLTLSSLARFYGETRRVWMLAHVEQSTRTDWWFAVYAAGGHGDTLYNMADAKARVRLTTGKMARAAAECVLEVLRMSRPPEVGEDSSQENCA